MKRNLRAFDGRRHTVDLDNPLVMVKGQNFTNNYQRGSLVYPISGARGKPTGYHRSEGWVTVSTLNTDVANFCGVEVGKTAVPLKDLVTTANELDIEVKQGRKGTQYRLGGRQIPEGYALELMLDHYLFMLLPEAVRNSSELSRVVSSQPSSHESGIILDSLDEVAYALKVYESGSVKGSQATEDEFYRDRWKSDNPNAGVDDPRIFRQTPEASFVQSALDIKNRGRGSLTDEMIADMRKSNGKYEKSFDYDAMGTRFFKTTVEVEPTDGKYVLQILAAYVGDEPEEELARTLDKKRALVRVGSKHILAPIIPDWTGVDLDKALKEGLLTADDLATLSRDASREIRLDPPYIVELHGIPVDLSFGFGQEDNYNADVVRTRGNKLFLKTEGQGEPYFTVNLRAPTSRSYLTKRIVHDEEKAKMIESREKLRELIDRNLS